MLIRKRNNAAEDTRGKTANCESGIIRARDPLLTLFLSHSFVFSSFLTYFLPPLSSISFLSSLYSFSLLHFFVRLSYPSSDRFLSLSPSLSVCLIPSLSSSLRRRLVGSVPARSDPEQEHTLEEEDDRRETPNTRARHACNYVSSKSNETKNLFWSRWKSCTSESRDSNEQKRLKNRGFHHVDSLTIRWHWWRVTNHR